MQARIDEDPGPIYRGGRQPLEHVYHQPLSVAHLSLGITKDVVMPTAVGHSTHNTPEIRNVVNHRDMGMLVPKNDHITVRELLDMYVRHIGRLVRIRERKKSTLDSYASWTGIVPEGCSVKPTGAGEKNFGDIFARSVHELQPNELKHWVISLALDVQENRRRGGDGHSTANRCLILLDSAFKWAIDEGHISMPRRPTASVERLTEVPRTRYLEPWEVSALRDSLVRIERCRVRSHRIGDRPSAYSPTQSLLLLSLTAMRLQEALTLRVEYIDLKSSVIKLPHSKTGYGEVPLNSAAADLLRKQLPRAQDGWVFPSMYGGSVRAVYEVWEAALEDSGIDMEGVVIHTLRHTVASLLKRRDVPVEVIQRVLRHKDQRTTEDAYVHVTVTRAVLDAVEAYSDMIGANRHKSRYRNVGDEVIHA